MRALKFYDKEGIGFELYADHEMQSVMMQVEAPAVGEDPQVLEFDEEDLDDIIIALVELKNEVIAIKNMYNN